MKIAKTVDEVREAVKAWRKEGLTVGLVPTMGYLHAGHQSLIAASVAGNDRTVVSVFVNPMQFGPTEDLESYPRDLNRDAELCEKTGADLIFNPEPEENESGKPLRVSDSACEERRGESTPGHYIPGYQGALHRIPGRPGRG
jgi:pantoate--beta-alanine ligase